MIWGYQLGMYQKWVSKSSNRCSLQDMARYHARLQGTKPLHKAGDVVKGRNRSGAYCYVLREAPATTAEDLHCKYFLQSGKERSFTPRLHPREMLAMGVFSGKMINDCLDEFPPEWFTAAIENKTLAPEAASAACNFYKVKSRQSLKEWRRQDWIYGDDERGWFQWYCRYAMGRRDEQVDLKQMKRWASIARWHGVFRKNPERLVVRQALLQWSWPHDLPQ